MDVSIYQVSINFPFISKHFNQYICIPVRKMNENIKFVKLLIIKNKLVSK